MSSKPWAIPSASGIKSVSNAATVRINPKMDFAPVFTHQNRHQKKSRQNQIDRRTAVILINCVL